MTKRSPFKYFKTRPEIIRLAVMMYIRFPLSLRKVEDLFQERGIDICPETVRCWRNRFGPVFAAELRRNRVDQMRGRKHWRWHLDEVFVKINGVTHHLWRAVRHEGEVLESTVTKTRGQTPRHCPCLPSIAQKVAFMPPQTAVSLLPKGNETSLKLEHCLHGSI